ncbi:hypothetical protein M407DRAFT_30412 [Tulasnella calospora MUT 4182]|uniref:RRM domain-containing protein n=1 Tax=Tulasnella calospora MUT 4182 TaxID=1051891 RepID=A0A0C3Q7E0_9AGAM|nr:hypothetical protein M407DRAFT_30412 [Tulasnella calospora MUT 4182]
MESNVEGSSRGNASINHENRRSRTVFVSDLSPLLFGTPPLVAAEHQQTNLRRLFSIFGPIEAISSTACRPYDPGPELGQLSRVPPDLAESPVSMDVHTDDGVHQHPVPPRAWPTRSRPPERVIFVATVSYLDPASAQLAQESLDGTEIGGNHMSASLVQNPIHIPDILTTPNLSHTGYSDAPSVAYSPSSSHYANSQNNGVDMLEMGPWNGEHQGLTGSSATAGDSLHPETVMNNLLLPLATFQPLPSPGSESTSSASSSYISVQHPLPLHQPQPIRPPTVDPSAQRLERQIEVLRRAVQNRATVPALQHVADASTGLRRRPTPLIAEAFRNSRIIARRNASSSDNSAPVDTNTSVNSNSSIDIDGESMEVGQDDVWARRGQPPELR